ncbi:hypothetical protein J2X50_004772 [Aminobacter sp. BE322]
MQPHLKSAPNRAIQQLMVVRSSYCHDVAWKLVNLHQKKGYDSLDFACFVRIASFFADGVELIKKQYAGGRPDVVK